MFAFAFLPPPAADTTELYAGEEGRARVRAINAALGRAWEAGWAERPTLDPDLLVRTAAIRSRHAPDADMIGWRNRLELLCADLESQARLTNLGRTIAHGQIVAALANRFRAHALWRRYPAIADQRIARPIIVLGQMRSGTTRMQRLLACDPRFTFTRFFESWNPLPARRRNAIFDDRKLRGWAGLLCARLLNPRFDVIHPTSCAAADEEIGLHNLAIYGSAFEAQWRVPNYVSAVEEGECLNVYREFKRLLQIIAWQRGDKGDRPHILKVPQFTQDLPALVKVFPDARLVCLSRDRDTVIASSASLVRNQRALQSDHVDTHEIGREWTRKVQLRQARMTIARAAADVPQIDVGFDDVTRDWEGQMQRVYRLLDLPLAPAVLARMQAAQARRHPHPPHHYDRAEFGLGDHRPMADRVATGAG